MAANKWEVLLDPDAFIPDATAHPDRAAFQNRIVWAFDASTQETIHSKAFRLPDAYASGTTTVAIAYCMASATANLIDWEVAVEAVTDNDAVDLDSASSYDAVNTYNATVPGTQGYLDIITGTLTNKDSMAAGDMVRISVSRDSDDATNDTATGDAYLLWVTIYEA